MLAWPASMVFAAVHLAGNVVAVDTQKHELTIIDAGKRRAVPLLPDTVVRQGSDTKSIADLHRGDRIIVTLDDDGGARIVSIAGPASAPVRAAPAHNRGGKGLPFLGEAPRPNASATTPLPSPAP
jgi:hypothetical protein